MQGILIIFSQLLAGCLVWVRSDLWIVGAALYIVFGNLVYHCTVEHKNSDIDYLSRRVEQLENLVKELQNIRNNSQCIQLEMPLRKE